MNVSHIKEVAHLAADKYGDDYFQALDVATCLIFRTNDVETDAARVHAVLEGEY